jgi:hypothetical protein
MNFHCKFKPRCGVSGCVQTPKRFVRGNGFGRPVEAPLNAGI